MLPFVTLMIATHDVRSLTVKIKIVLIIYQLYYSSMFRYSKELALDQDPSERDFLKYLSCCYRPITETAITQLSGVGDFTTICYRQGAALVW